MKHLHIAQFISFLRLVFAPLTLVYLSDWPHKEMFLLIIVIVSGITDFLDGYIARARGQESYLGAIHDFTADKLFILSALLVFSVAGKIPCWVTFIILYREIIVMGLRIYTSFHKVEIKASWMGKFKTLVLFVGLIVMLMGIEFYMIVIYISLAMTVISFFDYFLKFRKVVLTET
ncbi:MAG: CDP-alcohol phosphatidyltransferase family protein [Saprospiraceae bacterium]|nr:CDP-alcohol phosphatidyltransferase family protein [Bacteroidia bacterium]NNF20570.1 CDP-alcohol phosphatidyltransferase family protein [Saprospiraceae bacterium]